MEKENLFETPDLSFAAFLKMKGLKLYDVGRVKENSTLFKFIFEIESIKIEQLKVEYINSESYQFDMNARFLRSLVKVGGKIR